MGRRVRTVVFLTAAVWAMVVLPANAYIDAGTTGFLFSAALAFVAAAGLVIRTSWERLTRRLRRSPRDEAIHADPEEVA